MTISHGVGFMQLRGGGVFQLVVLSGKTPRRVLNFKKKFRGGFYPGEGFSNCYTGLDSTLGTFHLFLTKK